MDRVETRQWHWHQDWNTKGSKGNDNKSVNWISSEPSYRIAQSAVNEFLWISLNFYYSITETISEMKMCKFESWDRNDRRHHHRIDRIIHFTVKKRLWNSKWMFGFFAQIDNQRILDRIRARSFSQWESFLIQTTVDKLKHESLSCNLFNEWMEFRSATICNLNLLHFRWSEFLCKKLKVENSILLQVNAALAMEKHRERLNGNDIVQCSILNCDVVNQ